MSTTSRIQNLRLRLKHRALTNVSLTALPQLQTEMSGQLYWISDRLEDGKLGPEEQRMTLVELRELRDDISAVIEILEDEGG